MSKDDLIRSLPHLQKQAAELKQYRDMHELFTRNPLGRYLLEASGVDIAGLEVIFKKLGELEATFEKHVEAVYTFNNLFASRGWIVHDHLNYELIKAVNKKGLDGEMDTAEQMLIDDYSEENIRWKLKLFGSVKAFRPRVQLARQALEDYAAERYHACVPVVLALADGLVNELHETHRGLFTEGTDLIAWDSVAAHSQGLAVLVRLLSKHRGKTTTEPLTLPYRNGIMHGTDLGYANKMVAAKTWALLFTVRDWAARAENGQLNEPPKVLEPSLTEVFQDWQGLQKEQTLLEAWIPRDVTFGVDLPRTGKPEVYQPGTPERTLATLLTAWENKNYGQMKECMCWGIREMPPKEAFYRLREWYAKKPLVSFEFIWLERQAPGCLDIVTALRVVSEGVEQEQTIAFRLTCETSDGKSSFNGAKNARWGLFWWTNPS